MGPLEVVEERPDEVPAHVDAVRDRGVNGGEMLAEVVDPERIGDAIAVE